MKSTAVTLLDPPGLPEVGLYRQVSISQGTRLVHVAGQVAWDAEPDLAVQVEQAYANVATALAGAGGTVEDLVDVTVFVVDWSADKMPQLVDGLQRAAARLGATPVPPATLIGVAALDVPEHLVEIKAVAVLA